ncbi:MAG: peptidoglycan D,D-transpeptidase FtsI family protein, partial [Peptostreptococcaceae bacterium]
MKKIKRISKKRLVLVLILACTLFLGLTFRTGYLQIVKGDWLSSEAREQQTREIPIEPKRGTIYDRNMKEVAVSVTKYTVWCKPVEVKDKEEAAKSVAEILGKEYDDIYKLVNKKNMALVKIQRWIDDETATKIREASISGIWVAEDNQRSYPYGNFASYVIGHTSADSQGIAGVEMKYNKVLQGTAGKLIIGTDASGREIPQGTEKYYEPIQGNGLVLTIDEVIQHYTEKAVQKAYELNNAKRVSVIAMDPKTGDILAMSSKPDYDPNDSRTPIYPYYEDLLDEYSDDDKIKGYYQMWRNPLVSDTYEPGSTFKLITSAAGLEENVVKEDDKFVCTGTVTVGGRTLKCWRHYRPHGEQTFAQGVQNSCNPVFVAVGERLGVTKMYNYIEGFGFMDKTGIDLPGEAKGIVYNEKNVGPVELATMSFGQSISVTPVQLITAISAIANDGKLMQPRVVKAYTDNQGNITEEVEPKVVRQVISEETSDELMKIAQSVVSEGSGKAAYIP